MAEEDCFEDKLTKCCLIRNSLHFGLAMFTYRPKVYIQTTLAAPLSLVLHQLQSTTIPELILFCTDNYPKLIPYNIPSYDCATFKM